jgi:hypothetical protein
MQVYDFTVTTTAPQSIGAQGRYIKYLSGNAGGNDPTLYVQGGRNGEKAILKPGQALTFPKSWNDFTLSNYAGAATITGQVLIGDGRMDDSTLQGTVSTVDGGKARTLNGTAFAAYGNNGAVAGQDSRIQLWNPPGNPNRLIVEAFTILAATASITGGLVIQNAALATFQSYGASKKAGGANSVATLQTDSTAAAFPLQGTLLGLAAAVNTSPVFKFNEPVALLPGYGLTWWPSSPNTFAGAGFEWYEEANV